MSRLALIFMLMITLTINHSAQAKRVQNNMSEEERNKIEECLKHYFAAGDTANPDELSKAFYPGAMMFWADPNGEINYFTQRRWKSVLSENKNPVKALKRDIQITDCTKDICIAKIVSTFPDKIFYDYMAMVKIGGNWKIVSKVFQRADPKASPFAESKEDNANIESLLNTKFKSMDTNNPDLLASAYYSRAMSYTVDENQLVGVSIGEWIARFDFDQKNDAPIPKAERKIRQIDLSGAVGYARFTHEFADRVITDYVLLLKTENRWRIINLLYTREEKNG